MIFNGLSKTFSTENQQQYENIGAFWDEMSLKYGRENLRGLGYNWTENTIEYVLGLKYDDLPDANCNIHLPDNGWTVIPGRTEQLGLLYDEIYKKGNLKYEIETFNNNGSCKIEYIR